MKKLKLSLIALLAFVSVTTMNAQESEENSWTISLGFNALDFNAGDELFKDYLGNSDWNYSRGISRLSAGKYLNDAFHVEFAASFNKINTYRTENDVDWLYYGFDVNARYDLNDGLGDTGFFNPYVTTGLGYFTIQGDSQTSAATFNLGAGFNLWFNDSIGLNFQSTIKNVMGDDFDNHLQNSLGLIFKLGNGSDE